MEGKQQVLWFLKTVHTLQLLRNTVSLLGPAVCLCPTQFWLGSSSLDGVGLCAMAAAAGVLQAAWLRSQLRSSSYCLQHVRWCCGAAQGLQPRCCGCLHSVLLRDWKDGRILGRIHLPIHFKYLHIVEKRNFVAWCFAAVALLAPLLPGGASAYRSKHL